MGDYEVPPHLAQHFTAREAASYVKMFKAFDTSGDGAIDADELAEIMHKLGEKVTPEVLDEMIGEVDRDRSGAIEFNEFLQLMHNIHTSGDASSGLASVVMNSKYVLAVAEEVQELQDNPIDGCTVSVNEEDSLQADVLLLGAPNTPYAFGRFLLTIRFNNDYPYVPPSVRVRTRIFHPNIIPLVDGSGSVSHLLSDWTASWRMRNVVQLMSGILSCPDTSRVPPQVLAPQPTNIMRRTDGFDVAAEALNMYMTAPGRFHDVAARFTSQFAIFTSDEDRLAHMREQKQRQKAARLQQKQEELKEQEKQLVEEK